MTDQAAAAERIRRLAADIRASSPAPLQGQGRGLVIVAGGARIFTNAYVLVHMLRHALKSELPVELWYFGQAEVSAAMAALIEPLGVRLVDANPVIAATGANIRDGWQLKSFALLHSGFAEALLLDADQVPISDPAACFDWPEYVEAGAVFWPDIIDLRSDNAVWALLGLEPRRAVSLESGQMLVDRRRHGAALRAAVRLNEAADDLYRLIYGDKDTYLLAWQMLGAPYALVSHRPYTDEFMLVQRDFSGNALFQHRTNAKWQYGGEQRKLFGFQHEAACLAAMAELERRWSGHAFTAPDRSLGAREVEQELIAAGEFVLESADEPAFTIRLGEHAEVGAGRAVDRRHWWVEDSGGSHKLVLSGSDRPGYVLERGDDRIWRGQRHRVPIVDVSLYGVAGAEPVALPAPGLVDELLRAGGAFGGPAGVSQQLVDALGLIAAVLPGVRERIATLAGLQTDPIIASRLLDLAERVTPPPPLSRVDRTLKFETGYIRAEIPE
ncbi:hypothetical protein ASC89_11685 [Devosia sp. Root413D1]|uniref:hypothetical protein n=1 Tax=Devosia sp. Root413D1 TaxID=1736531 RepID=UPI0006FA01E4|nr:hypothetical protein [Devosia sp. Root413D1]KQW78964.1 hypothetical protein ASC89_11685 [Devosia sp. Root413D1]